MDQAGRYQGRVGESALTLLEAPQMQDEICNLLERVLQYAMMRRDEESTNPRTRRWPSGR